MTFTKQDVKGLRAAYEKAVKDGIEVFVFKGQELFTGYAKYLLEYLESKLCV